MDYTFDRILSCESEVTVDLGFEESASKLSNLNLNNIDDRNIDEGSALSPNIDAENINTGGDTDTDGAVITYQCKYDVVIDGKVSSPTDCSSIAGLTFDISTGIFNWIPDQQAYSNGDTSGRYEFKIIGSSEGGSDEESFVITVNAVDVAPSLTAQSNETITLGDAITSVNNNDSEDATNACNLNGLSFDTGTGVLSGTPDTVGVYEFQITGSSNGGSDAIFFTITVEEPPHSNFTQIALGDSHSCALTSEGDVYCWGNDNRGQLGYAAGTGIQREPILVNSSNLNAGEKFTQISLGFYYTCGITSEGNTYCWGSDTSGKLGNGGADTDQDTPILIDSSNLNAGEKFTQIALGNSHTCGTTSEGNVYCWGSDFNGQLGDGGANTNQVIPVLIDSSNLNAGEKFTQIALGDSHTCGITSEGNTYCWGNDTLGQLGDGGANTDQNIPTLIDSSNLNAGEKFTQISLGFYHTCGITSEGNTYCWGSDAVSQLGDGGTNTDQNIPTLIDSSNLNAGEKFTEVSLGGSGSLHTCGVTSEGNTYCWGSDMLGQLGDGGTNTDQNIPTLIDNSNLNAGEKFTQISLGKYHVCGLSSEGNTYCWGDGSNGQLGNGAIGLKDKPFLINVSNLTPAQRFKTIALGNSSGCGLTSEGNIYCWGSDYLGKLGNGSAIWQEQNAPILIDDANLISGEKFIELSFRESHGCGITSEGNTYCWGANGYGQLGDGGTNSDQSKPILIDSSNLNAGEKFSQLSLGNNHSCGLTAQGNIYCWGRNNYGQLGDGGTNSDQNIPTLIDSSNLNAGEKFINVSLGVETSRGHSCGITSEGNAYCWGFDGFGQLGDGGTNTNQNKPVLVDSSNLNVGEKFTQLSLGSHSCGLTSQGNTYCWGSNSNGKLGIGSWGGTENKPVLIDSSSLSSGEKFIQLALTYDHSCGLTSKGNAYCWGGDSQGALGDGGINTDQNIPTLIDVSNLVIGEKFILLALGTFHSCGLTSHGNSYCWGPGSFGELGDGTFSAEVGMPTNIVDESNF